MNDEEITDMTAKPAYEGVRTVTEVCNNCMRAIEMVWDVHEDGYKAYCPVCGERLMLCDECRHDSNGDYTDDCDYDSSTDTCKHNRAD